MGGLRSGSKNQIACRDSCQSKVLVASVRGKSAEQRSWLAPPMPTYHRHCHHRHHDHHHHLGPHPRYVAFITNFVNIVRSKVNHELIMVSIGIVIHPCAIFQFLEPCGGIFGLLVVCVRRFLTSCYLCRINNKMCGEPVRGCWCCPSRTEKRRVTPVMRTPFTSKAEEVELQRGRPKRQDIGRMFPNTNGIGRFHIAPRISK